MHDAEPRPVHPARFNYTTSNRQGSPNALSGRRWLASLPLVLASFSGPAADLTVINATLGTAQP